MLKFKVKVRRVGLTRRFVGWKSGKQWEATARMTDSLCWKPRREGSGRLTLLEVNLKAVVEGGAGRQSARVEEESAGELLGIRQTGRPEGDG